MNSPAAKTPMQFSDIHWKSLRYFSIYRLCIAVLLFASSLPRPSVFSLLSAEKNPFQIEITGVYVLCALASLLVVHLYRQHFNRQVSLQVVTDVIVLTLLAHTGGGLKSGMGILLLVTLAGAGLVGQGRLVLFYAAIATIAMLGEHIARTMSSNLEVVDFFEAGLFCTGFFAVAISARLLANRVIANEELARKRGEELRNQTVISQHIIEEMQDGVLVLDRRGHIKQSNPRVERLLGLGNPTGRELENYSTELAQGFRRWCEHEHADPVMVRAPASGMHLRARFVIAASPQRDVLVFLEDLSRLQEQARQLKLAALGRLTANIAHEIRNPLSAIKHAGELLQEETSNPTEERLLRIINDNAQRVENIVNDILQLGRRDRAHREQINLRQMLPLFIEEFMLKEEAPDGLITTSISGRGTLLFDRSHFTQVLWNLVGNALRHSQKTTGSIRIQVSDTPHDSRIELHVIDDGKGVDESLRDQIFEPFFTTHSRGTGLGLYIARELCDANGAQLDLRPTTSGADFCVSGRSIE